MKLAAVARGALSRPIRATGTLQLKSEADLSFKVAGLVTRVAADTGARVRKGQLLATIDPTELEATRQAAAETLRKAERDRARMVALQDSGSTAAVDIQNADTALAQARAADEVALFNLRHATLLAPADAVIDKRLMEVGEIATPGRPIFHVRGASRGAVVRVQVVDRDALQLRLGDHARVKLDALSDRELAARVTSIASSASPTTGTIEVELQLSPADAASLPSGLTAKVEIEHKEYPHASVPLSALVDGEGSSAAVYIVQGDRAKRVAVRVRFLVGDRAALASGLANVNAIVDQGAARLADGSLVRIME